MENDDRKPGRKGTPRSKAQKKQGSGGGDGRKSGDSRRKGSGGGSQGSRGGNQGSGGGGNQGGGNQGGGNQGKGGRRRHPKKRRGGRNRRRSGGGPMHSDNGEATVAVAEELETREGLLEILPEGYGFLRFVDNYYLPDENDVYVNANIVRRFSIRPGSMIVGEVAPPRKRGQKPNLHRVLQINKREPEAHANETPFKNLVPCDPYERIELEVPVDPNISMRIIDLLTPIGRGQRALIVAPPRSGKTVILQQMANAITTNYPEMKAIILLIDERPEEVTDMKRNTQAEVIASCLDEGTANHVRVTEMVLDKLRRMVEAGEHVVCLLDSITRLGRAYNNETKHSGRILSGGVDAKTLAKPKAFFGAARTIEGGGSLTIIATALIETGSRMDQVIFEEFKGTGNMELVLSRQLANNRIFPAIDINMSGTRKEEKLLPPDDLRKIHVLRRVLNQLKPNEAMRLLIDRMEKTSSNAEFLAKFDIEGG